jgi:hypothetical protein
MKQIIRVLFSKTVLARAAAFLVTAALTAGALIASSAQAQR